MYVNTVQSRQDLFQEIVLQLWRSYPNFKGNSKVSTWMYRVAINTAITAIRKKRPDISFFEVSQLPELSSENSSDSSMHTILYSAIAMLNEIEKAIVMLYLENKSYSEMQEIIGLNEGALKVRMNRIKEKLRKLTHKI